jgi:hypothetical protein
MNKKHMKSPCYREKIIKFGNRRRQCTLCKKTWRIRHKKVGRKTKRVSSSLFLQYVKKENATPFVLSKTKHKNEDSLQRDLRKSLLQFTKKTRWLELEKDKDIIVIADAMMITVNKKLYTFYFILLRLASSNRAITTEPFIKEGSESCKGWKEAFAKLPVAISVNIRALVSDGHVGLLSTAKENNWLIQRCNFHIIAKILGRRSKGPKSRHRETGEKLYQLTCIVLQSKSNKKVQEALNQLKTAIEITSSTQLKTYLSGFIKHHQEYRTYIKYSDLNLPRTSNSAEALIGMMRELCRRAHGFRIIDSLKLWICAFLKYKKDIRCNPSLPTKLMR